MAPRFFFTQPANVCNPEPWRGRPGILFEGEPLWFALESDAVISARRQWSKEDYDVILLFAGDWSGNAALVRSISKYSDGQLQPPIGYDVALSNTVEDAEYVLRRMLDEYISLRS